MQVPDAVVWIEPLTARSSSVDLRVQPSIALRLEGLVTARAKFEVAKKAHEVARESNRRGLEAQARGREGHTSDAQRGLPQQDQQFIADSVLAFVRLDGDHRWAEDFFKRLAAQAHLESAATRAIAVLWLQCARGVLERADASEILFAEFRAIAAGSSSPPWFEWMTNLERKTGPRR
jgi:hypothetical protein